MQKLDYVVTNWWEDVRRTNWENFIKTISWKKNNKIAILSLHFNNFNNTKNLLEYIWNEKNKNIDIIIIENSTKEVESEKLTEYIQDLHNITKIVPISNIGSAWWYALWMEYILNNDYEYFFLVEDDVEFLERNVFSDMIEKSDNKTLTFILNCQNTRTSSNPEDKWRSNHIQIAWYPVNFVKKIGIMDPRYFFRWEDLDRKIRLENWLKKFDYKYEIINHNYIHPYLKSVNGNMVRFYLSIRNQLLILKKYPLIYYKFFINLFLYFFTGVTKLIIHQDTWMIQSFYNAVKDFLGNKYSFSYNTERIRSFIVRREEKISQERIDSESLKKIIRPMYGNAKMLVIPWIDIEQKLSFSHKIWDMFSHWIVISSSSTIFYPLTAIAPKVVCIQEFDLHRPLISIYTYKNKYIILHLLWVIISLCLSVWLIIIIDIVIILYISYTQCLRKK